MNIDDFKNIIEPVINRNNCLLWGIEILRGKKKNTLRVFNGIWWMSGYILTKRGAQKLIDNLPVVGPVDVWINHIFPEMDVFMSKENLIVQADGGWSDNTYSFPAFWHDPTLGNSVENK